MGFFDNLKEALGGDHHDRAAAVDSTAPREQPRHVDPHAPAESDADATVVTGGKHAARD